MLESNIVARSVLKFGAVTLSLALMGGYVWYRSGGSPAAAETNANTAAREIMSGSKSERVFVPRRDSAAAPELVVAVDPAEKSPARKELMYSSKSGAIFVPDAAPTAAPVDVSESNTLSNAKSGRTVIELTPEQSAALSKAIAQRSNPGAEFTPAELKALRELQEMTKTLPKTPEAQPRPDTAERRTAQERAVPATPSAEHSYVIEQTRSSAAPATPPPAQPPRRVLMPSSKSMVLPSDRVYVVPAPRGQAQQQAKGF